MFFALYEIPEILARSFPYVFNPLCKGKCTSKQIKGRTKPATQVGQYFFRHHLHTGSVGAFIIKGADEECSCCKTFCIIFTTFSTWSHREERVSVSVKVLWQSVILITLANTTMCSTFTLCLKLSKILRIFEKKTVNNSLLNECSLHYIPACHLVGTPGDERWLPHSPPGASSQVNLVATRWPHYSRPVVGPGSGLQH